MSFFSCWQTFEATSGVRWRTLGWLNKLPRLAGGWPAWSRGIFRIWRICLHIWRMCVHTWRMCRMWGLGASHWPTNHVFSSWVVCGLLRASTILDLWELILIRYCIELRLTHSSKFCGRLLHYPAWLMLCKPLLSSCIVPAWRIRSTDLAANEQRPWGICHGLLRYRWH